MWRYSECGGTVSVEWSVWRYSEWRYSEGSGECGVECGVESVEVQ